MMTSFLNNRKHIHPQCVLFILNSHIQRDALSSFRVGYVKRWLEVRRWPESVGERRLLVLWKLPRTITTTEHYVLLIGAGASAAQHTSGTERRAWHTCRSTIVRGAGRAAGPWAITIACASRWRWAWTWAAPACARPPPPQRAPCPSRGKSGMPASLAAMEKVGLIT